MKKLLCVFLLLSVRLLAVNPVPYTESMGFSFKIDGTGTSIMTVYDETSTVAISATSSGSSLESDSGTAWMIPGKTYTIAFWGLGPPDYTMSFIAPDGYSVYVNGVATNMVSLSPGTGWHLEYYKVELRPVVGVGGGHWGQFSGISVGKAISWSVGLGDLRTGRSAGGIQFKEPDLSGSPASRDMVFYAAPPANVGQVVVVYDPTSIHRLHQVVTPIGFTDLTDLTDKAGGYEIRFYLWGQVVRWTGTEYTFSGTPWKTIKVESPASSQLKITETQGSVVHVSTLTGTSDSVASGGTVTTANGYTLHTFTAAGTFTASQDLSSVDYLVVGGGGGGGSHNDGGGGGSGSVEYLTGQSVASGSYSVTVGAGGAADANGGNSSFNSTTAYGGGHGGSSSVGTAPATGGSGGGGYTNGVGASAGSGSNVYTGGGGDNGGSSWQGGGGGGAGGNTQNPAQGGGTYSGGNGLANAITGVSVDYAGGGGGGTTSGIAMAGGSGGGGAGGYATSTAGSAGGANTGGGGGGSAIATAGSGGAGGSGIVIIRYRTMGQGAYTWTLQEGDATIIARTTVHTSTVPAINQRDDVEAVYNGNSTSSADLVSKTNYHYFRYSWGEELDSVTADPDTAALKTSYTYYTDAANLGNYRRVQSVTLPTGGWTVYQYYDDWYRRGQLEYQIQPWLDSPSTASSASTTTGHVFHYEDYDADWTGRHTIPTVRKEFVNNVQVGQTDWSHGDDTGSGEPRTHMTIKSYYAGSNYQSDYVENYRADADPDYAGEPYQTKSANQAQDSVSISRGTFNTTTKAFTVSSSGDHWREMHFHGSTNNSGATAVTGFDGQTCPSVYMIPNKSTLDVTIRIAPGYVYRTETWVYTGGSSFSLLKSVDFDYDAYGNQTQRLASNGALTNNTYTDGQLVSTVDPSGMETYYTYDSLGRVHTSTKVAATGGAYADQPAIATTYTLDAANHVTQTVTSGGTNSLTSSNHYDPAGRLYQAVAPGGYTTGIGYTSGGRVVTTTLPSLATKVTEVYPDGHAKSVTGTSLVAQYFSYPSIPISGMVSSQVKFGNNSTSTNIVITTNDWLGRETTEVKPAWSGSNVTKTWTYDGTTGLLTKLSQPGLADTLYSYDTMGILFRECLDVSGNDAIDLASSDRITEHGWTYVPDGSSNWWLSQTTSTYAGTGSTATQLGKVETQLSGLPTNRFSVTKTSDIHDNVTTQTVDVNRSSKLVTTTTTYPDASTSAVQIAYNGLTVSSLDKTNLTTTYAYDDLGRTTSVTDPRTGPNTTVYVSGTNQVDKFYDAYATAQLPSNSGFTPTKHYHYASTSGRVDWTADALGKKTYFSYNNRDQVTNQWGENIYPVEYQYDTDFGWKKSMSTYQSGSGWTGSSWPSSPPTADVTQWNYQDATGLLESKVSAYGTADAKTVSYTYTDAGQMHVRTSARSITTTYAYDSATSELTGVTYSDGTPSLTYHYNRIGKQDSITDSTGTYALNYNLSGTLELQSEDLPSFYGSRRITYPVASSGVIGRPTGLQLGSSGTPTADESATYGYETATGRFNSLVANGTTLSYTYTTNSNLLESIEDTTSGTGTGWKQSRTYVTNRDLLDTIETKFTATSAAKFHYILDDLGRRTIINKSGGMFSSYGDGTQGLDTHYAYDDRSEVIGEKTELGGTSTVLTGQDNGDSSTPGYAYDNIGNRASSAGTKHNGNPADYTTNALNQYTQRTVPGIFDVAGADTATTVTVSSPGGPTDTATRHGDYFFDGYALTNSSNAVCTTLTITGTGTPSLPAFVALTPESFIYDDDGNLTSDGRWDYTYDAENRLISMQTHAALTASIPTTTQPIPYSDARKLEFTYDCLGRRVEKIVRDGYNGTSYTSVVSDEKFVYDGWNCMAKLNALSSNALMAAYYWGLDWSGTIQGAGGVGGLALVADSGSKYLPIFDGNGNVMGMVNAGTGSIDAAYEYDAFGQTLRESGSYAASNCWRFSTKYTDLETSLVYYGHRFYSPSLGRFINRDPIEEQGGLNLYSFCQNNTVNAWDYLGMTEGVTMSDPYYVTTSVDPNDNYLLYGYGYSFYDNPSWSVGLYPVGSSGGGSDQSSVGSGKQSGVDSSNTGVTTPTATIDPTTPVSQLPPAQANPVAPTTQPPTKVAPNKTENSSIWNGVGSAVLSNINLKGGADAAFYLGTSNTVSRNVTAATGGKVSIDGAIGYGGIAYGGFEGHIQNPKISQEPQVSVGFMAAFGLSIGVSLDVVVHSSQNGTPYPVLSGVNFFLGLGFGGEAKIDFPSPSTTLLDVNVNPNGTQSSHGLLIPARPSGQNGSED